MEKDKNLSIDSLNCIKTCSKIDVPTEEEVEALSAMKKIKDRVRAIKQDLSGISLTGEDTVKKTDLEGEMGHLKKEWEKWEKKREKAAKERMILLGHEKP